MIKSFTNILTSGYLPCKLLVYFKSEIISIAFLKSEHSCEKFRDTHFKAWQHCTIRDENHFFCHVK